MVVNRERYLILISSKPSISDITTSKLRDLQWKLINFHKFFYFQLQNTWRASLKHTYNISTESSYQIPPNQLYYPIIFIICWVYVPLSPKIFLKQNFARLFRQWRNHSCQFVSDRFSLVSLAIGNTLPFSVQTVDGHLISLTVVLYRSTVMLIIVLL